MVRAAFLLFAEEGGLGAQRALLSAHALREGWTPVREFTLPSGAEGLPLRQAVFQELLAEAHLHRIDTVLIAAATAAAAAPGEIGPVAAALRLEGVRSVSVDTEGNGTPLDPGAHMEGLLRFVADLQSGARRRASSARRSESRRREVLRGEWAGGRPPYGFRLAVEPGGEGGRLSIDADEAAVVREIFRLYTEAGLGSPRIAEELNRRGDRLRSGGPWNDSAVRAVLRSPMASGRPAYGRTWRDPRTGKQRRRESGAPEVTLARSAVPEWEIVDFEMFRRAQDRLQARRPKGPPRTGEQLLLSGIARCGHCGGPLTAGHAMPKRRLKDGTVRHYRYARYDCRTRAGGGHCGGYRGYASSRVEGVVLAAVPHALERLRQSEVLQVVRQRIEEASWRHALLEEKAGRREKQAEEAMARLFRGGALGTTPDAERIRAIARREAEAELVAARSEATKVRAGAQHARLQMDLVEQFLLAAPEWWRRASQGSPATHRAALRRLVGTVHLSRTGVEIGWRVDLSKLAGAHDASALEWTERIAWPPRGAH